MRSTLLNCSIASRELPLQEEDPAELIEHDAIARIKIGRRTQVSQRLVVAAVVFQRDAKEEMGLRQFRIDGQRAPQHILGAGEVAFLEPRTPDVHPAVRVLRVHGRDFLERRFGAFQIALKKQPDAVIVPPFADRWMKQRLDARRRRPRHR